MVRWTFGKDRNSDRYYWLKTHNDAGTSGFSAVISNTTFRVAYKVPKFVAGLRLEKSGGKNMLSWSAVTRNSDNSELTPAELNGLDYYRIYRSTSPDGPWNVIGTASGRSYEDGVSDNTVYYYNVTAVNKGNNEGENWFTMDSSDNRNTIIQIDDGTGNPEVKIIIPYNSAGILYMNDNGYQDDLWVSIIKTPGEEDVVGYYEVRMMKYADDKVLSGADFNGDVQYSFYYKVDPATGYIENTRMLLPEQADRFLGVYRHNGIEWVFQGGKIDTTHNCIVFNSQKGDRYAVRVRERAKEFTLRQLEPKKIFTPYGEEPHKEMRFYFENPELKEAKCVIFTLRGRKVTELSKKMLSDTDGYFYWDGKDDNNEMVSGGVYIYQLECGGKRINGTVILAK
ncbi:MAG: hypothetical protein KKH98_06345 [Spirochaetes bacterium]|nr:hypothetical protein [Spirochaetota bacterium]